MANKLNIYSFCWSYISFITDHKRKKPWNKKINWQFKLENQRKKIAKFLKQPNIIYFNTFKNHVVFKKS